MMRVFHYVTLILLPTISTDAFCIPNRLHVGQNSVKCALYTPGTTITSSISTNPYQARQRCRDGTMHSCGQGRSLSQLASYTANKKSNLTVLNASLSGVVWVAASAIGGMTGAPIVIQSTKTWYNDIPLPSYTPPNRIFAPVWTTLYTLMGIASWRIRGVLAARVQSMGNISSLSPIQEHIVAFSLVHYAMNISWAPIFFGLKRLRAGHVLNVGLVMTLLPIMAVYLSLDFLSGILLVPYLAWLILATKLSWDICKLNPTEVKNGYWYNNAKLQDQIWKLRREAARKVGL